jgi:1-acyl-sn-glycerol-3-phosphate acyltransferase
MTTAARPDLGKRIFYRLCRALVITPFKILFRVHVRGREKLPRSGAYVVAPSHRSLMDIFFTPYISRRRLRFMAKQELYERRFFAWLFTALGGFPVERGAADRTALRAAQDVLRGGEPLVVFPEGTRNSGPEIGTLFDGAAYLAARLGVPLVPIGVGGTEQILASGRSIPRLHRVAIVVGDPIQPRQPDGTRVRRQEIADLTAKLRVVLQECFDEAQALAGVRSASELGQG